MRSKVLDKYDTITVGEMPFVRDEDEILKVVGEKSGELNMIFIFELVDIDNVQGSFRMTWRNWDANEIKQIVNRYQRLMIERDGWNSVFCENHDNPRSVSRYADDSDEYRELGAKLLSLMQTTIAGTLYVYQGEELGMKNVPAPPAWDISEYKDIETINYWQKSVSPSNPLLPQPTYHLPGWSKRPRRTPNRWTSPAKSSAKKRATTPAHPSNGPLPKTQASAHPASNPGCASTTTTRP